MVGTLGTNPSAGKPDHDNGRAFRQHAPLSDFGICIFGYCAMTSPSIETYRRRNEDAPLDVVRENMAWQPVIRLIDAWAKEKLGSASGYTSQELDDISRTRGIRFPAVVREWWRLAGLHPFVQTGLMPGNAVFLRPCDGDVLSPPDLFAITIDDEQTGARNGIHIDFLAEADPPVHGINTTIGPDDAPSLDWYKGAFIATGLSVPALVHATVLYHLFEPSPLVVDGAVYLEVEREGLGLPGGEPDTRLVSALGLDRFPNDSGVGDIYCDGEEIIYWWMMGCACRTAEAADRVRQIASTKPRRRWE